MPLILPGNVGSATAATGFNVSNSLRFNRGSSDYLNRTQGTPTDVDKATFSTWIKFSDVTSSNDTAIFAATADGNNTTHLEKLGSQVFRLNMREGSNYIGRLVTNRVFRDPSAWYHIVVAFDTNQGTEANRVKLYINGVQETSFSTATYPTQNIDLRFNTSGQVFNIGNRGDTGNHPDAYFAETVFIDGLQLAADQFGEFDSDSGIWKPINVSGLTFGNNGFYLQYKETGTSANASGIGADTSGETNHFTVNNLTAVDQSIDTCTNNFCVMNPLDNLYGAATFAEGNLQVTTRNAGYSYNTATFGVASGKWYWEIKYSAQTTADSSTNQFMPGIAKSVAISSTDHMGYRNTSYAYQSGGNLFYNNGTTSSGYDAYGIGDIAGIALDIDNLRLYVSKNGTFQNSADPAGGSDGYTITAPDAVATDLGFYFPAFGDGNDNDIKVGQLNFGSPIHAISSGNTDGNGFGNFEYAVPSGFFALCTKNLAENG